MIFRHGKTSICGIRADSEDNMSEEYEVGKMRLKTCFR